MPALDDGPERYARWGEQLDVHNITRDGDDQAGEFSAEQVPGYIAKYASKATESFGSGLDRRLGADDLDHLDNLAPHIGELVRACWELGAHPQLDELRLRAWAHMLGFGGHWSTKSHRSSTTFTVLHRARVAFAKRRRTWGGEPLDTWGRPEDDQAVEVLASWVHVGCGYETVGSAGWPCRRPRGLGSSGGWPGRPSASTQPEQEQGTDGGQAVDQGRGRRAAGHVGAVHAPVSVRAPDRLVKVGRHVRIAEADPDAFTAAGRVDAVRRQAG